MRTLANETILHHPRPVRETGSASAHAAACRVWLARLRVAEFRCYAEAEIAADDRPVVLTGPNGAGKTNLLEAISFLSPGRGLRRAKLAEVVRRKSPDR